MKINQIKSGVILSYVTLILNIFVGILFTPFMLRSLGQSEYGLYQLIGALVGYITILDFGLGNTIIRYVAKYRAEENKEREENFLAVCFIIYFIISICVLLIGIICYFNIEKIFINSLTINELIKAKAMFAIMIFNLAISLPLNSFPSIMSGYERFIFSRVINITRILIRTGIVFLFLIAGYKSLTIVILDTILNIIFMIIEVLYVLVILKVRIKLHSFQRTFVIEIISYSFFVFLNMIVDQLYWRLGQLILGIYANTAAVAIFALAMQIVQYYIIFSTAISGVFLPRATRMVVNNSSGEEMTDLFIKTGRIQFMILGLILTGFTLFGRLFITLWAGPEYVDSFTIALSIMIPLTVPLFQNIGISILQAKNLHAFRSIIYVVIAIINATISMVLVRPYGPIGAGVGTVLSLIIGPIIIINLYYHHKVGLNIPRFFKELFKGILPVVMFSVVGGFITFLIKGESWGILGVRSLIFSTIYLLLLWKFGMNNYESGLVKEPVLIVKKKLKGLIYDKFSTSSNG